MTTVRTKIRRYAVEMLKAEVPVGGRVFTCRKSSPVFPDELPAVVIAFGDETLSAASGGIRVKEYERVVSVSVIVLAESIRKEDDAVNTAQAGEDFVDYLGYRVESAFNHDWNFARRLPGFDPDVHNTGLLFASVLRSVVPYDVETEGGMVLAQSLQFELGYQTPGYADLKLQDFDSFLADIVRVGATAETVDPVLISAEGNLK